jgi:hypothetical protein
MAATPNIPPPKGTKDSVLRKKLLKKYQAWKLAIHTNIEASSAATVQRSRSIVVCIGIWIYVNKVSGSAPGGAGSKGGPVCIL